MINRLIFYDREDELGFLEEEYRRQRFSLVVVYGRRRTGKTFLLRRFLEGKERAIYLYVSEKAPEELRSELAWELEDKLGVRLPRGAGWRELFTALLRASASERAVLVVDEFQRLLDVDKSALSELQRVVDEEGASSRAMIVVSGSSVGMMERFFRQGQPLYGRTTGFLKVRPFDFRRACGYLRRRLGATPEEALSLYAVFGGTPYYLSLLESSDWEAEARRLVLDPMSPLYHEPEFLLRTELRGSLVYFEVLRLLASGKSSFSELAGSLRVARTSLSYYLRVLVEDLDIVERVEPVAGGRPVYRVRDNFYRFWFRYVHPRRSLLELGRVDDAVEAVRRDFRAYLGEVFQDVAREWLARARLPFRLGGVGGWFGRGVEIDAVAVSSDGSESLVLEAKCRHLDEAEARRVLAELREKAKALPVPPRYYGVAALSVGGREELESEGYFVVELGDLC